MFTIIATFALVSTTAAAFTAIADTYSARNPRSFSDYCGSSDWNAFTAGLGL